MGEDGRGERVGSFAVHKVPIKEGDIVLDVMDFGEVECCCNLSNSQGLSCLACCKRKVERSSSFPGELYYCFKTTPLTMCKKYLSSVKVSLGKSTFWRGNSDFCNK